MHSAIVSVERPKSFSNKGWNKTLSDLYAIALRHPSIEVLGNSCLLVPMNETADAFRDALNVAANSGFAYRLLFFKKPPKWVRSSRATSE